MKSLRFALLFALTLTFVLSSKTVEELEKDLNTKKEAHKLTEANIANLEAVLTKSKETLDNLTRTQHSLEEKSKSLTTRHSQEEQEKTAFNSLITEANLVKQRNSNMLDVVLTGYLNSQINLIVSQEVSDFITIHDPAYNLNEQIQIVIEYKPEWQKIKNTYEDMKKEESSKAITLTQNQKEIEEKKNKVIALQAQYDYAPENKRPGIQTEIDKENNAIEKLTNDNVDLKNRIYELQKSIPAEEQKEKEFLKDFKWDGLSKEIAGKLVDHSTELVDEVEKSQSFKKELESLKKKGVKIEYVLKELNEQLQIELLLLSINANPDTEQEKVRLEGLLETAMQEENNNNSLILSNEQSYNTSENKVVEKFDNLKLHKIEEATLVEEKVAKINDLFLAYIENVERSNNQTQTLYESTDKVDELTIKAENSEKFLKLLTDLNQRLINIKTGVDQKVDTAKTAVANSQAARDEANPKNEKEKKEINDLEEELNKQKAQEEEESASTTKKIWIAVTSIIVIIALGVGFWFYRRKTLRESTEGYQTV